MHRQTKSELSCEPQNVEAVQGIENDSVPFISFMDRHEFASEKMNVANWIIHYLIIEAIKIM